MAISIVSGQYSSGDDVVGTNDSVLQNPTTIEETLPINSTSIDAIVVDANTENTEEVTNNIDDDSSWIQSYHPEEQTEITATKEAESATIISSPQEANAIQNPVDDIFAGATTPVEIKQEEQIPNLYIQADQQAHVAQDADSTQINMTEPSVSSDGGFDMDDLLEGDNTAAIAMDESPIASVSNPGEIVEKDTVSTDAKQDPFMQQQTTDAIVATKTNAATQQTPVTAKVAKKGSLVKGLAVLAAGCLGVLVLWFVAKTMFPLGLSNTPSDTIDMVPILTQDDIIEAPVEQEHSADTRTEQEIIIDQLQDYTAMGTSFYELGRDLKDRNMVRYALYVEKKSQDLLDELASNPNMDTKDIVVYFAQFDDYLRTLREWQEGTGQPLPQMPAPMPMDPFETTNEDLVADDSQDSADDIQESQDTSINDPLQGIPGFNSLFPSNSDDTIPGSFKQQPAPEQSELSDG